jgi:hypothetical protein
MLWRTNDKMKQADGLECICYITTYADVCCVEATSVASDRQPIQHTSHIYVGSWTSCRGSLPGPGHCPDPSSCFMLSQETVRRVNHSRLVTFTTKPVHIYSNIISVNPYIIIYSIVLFFFYVTFATTSK